MRCVACEAFPATLEALVGWRHFHSARACWWLAREVYRRHLGIPLSAARGVVLSGAAIRHSGLRWLEVRDPARYDLVLLQGPQVAHVGVALGAEAFVHVPDPAAGVCRSALWRVRRDLVGVYRPRGPEMVGD